MEGQVRRLRLHFFLANAVLITAAILFLLLDRYDAFDPFLLCPLHVLGLYCPTCGMTRATHALLSLDLAASLALHPLLPLVLLTALYYELCGLLHVLLGRPSRLSRAGRIPLLVTVAALLLFFLLRNLLLLWGIDPVGDFLPSSPPSTI